MKWKAKSVRTAHPPKTTKTDQPSLNQNKRTDKKNELIL